MTEEERGRRRAALLLVPMLLLGAAFCFWTLFASVNLGEAESFIPAPLGSDALANYGEDEITGRLRSLSISIVEAVIRDRDPEEEDAGARATDVSESLKSPVPTVTPKPGDPTGTPTVPPTSTVTPDLTVTGTATLTASPSPLPTRTSTATDVPTVGPTSTSGPSPTPSKTPTPTVCKVPPHIEILAPLNLERFTLAEQLPRQAFAFDPDNANPLTCSITPPGSDGQGITGDPQVHMKIEWFDGSSWVLVHTELESNDPYCEFTSCTSHDLSGGFWPDSPPIPISTGLHRLKAKVLQDDEGVASGWVSVDFYIDPLPTATPSNTPTSTFTPVPPTPTDTPLPSCPDFALSIFGDDDNNLIWWTLTNNGATPVTMERVEITWIDGGNLTKVELDGSSIWTGSAGPTYKDITSVEWTGVSRLFNSSDAKQLRFTFSGSVSNNYTIDVHSSNGCVETKTGNAS